MADVLFISIISFKFYWNNYCSIEMYSFCRAKHLILAIIYERPNLLIYILSGDRNPVMSALSSFCFGMHICQLLAYHTCES